ncbi:MAG: ABC transporter permease [Acidobacteria bacterium]|jgi:ABC-2 type transport system permease protein|nr:ABC transporter permease [Acidobacteriota bacterium]
MSWRQIFAIAFTDIKRMLRRRDTILWLIIMPLPYTYFFGVAFHSSPKEKPKVVVVAPQPDDASRRLVATLSKANYEVTRMSTWSSQKPLPKRGFRVDLPPALGTVLLDGTSARIDVWSRSGDLDATKLKVNVEQAVLSLRAELLAHVVRGEAVTAASLAEPLKVVPITVEAADWGKKREVPSGFKQAIPGNMVMFVLMSVLVTGAIRLLGDREAGHLQRMLASPISERSIVLSQFISLALLGICEALYFLLLGRVVFGQSIGEHPVAVIGVLILMVAAAAGVGIVLGATLKTAKQAGAVGIFGTLVLAALGGCWWPMEILPAGMKTLALALPTGQTMHALVRLTVWGDPPSTLSGYLAYMVLFAIASGVIAVKVLRKRLA